MANTQEVRDALNVLVDLTKGTVTRLETEFLPLLDPALDYIGELAKDADTGNGRPDPVKMSYICCCLQMAATRFGSGLLVAMGERHYRDGLQMLTDSIVNAATEPSD